MDRVKVPAVVMPLGTLVYLAVAIPLSAMNPRIGRSINLFAALLLYVLYNNLMSVMQAWVAQGRVPFGIGVWIVHAALAALIAWMFRRRLTLPRRSWLAWLMPRRQGAAT